MFRVQERVKKGSSLGLDTEWIDDKMDDDGKDSFVYICNTNPWDFPTRKFETTKFHCSLQF